MRATEATEDVGFITAAATSGLKGLTIPARPAPAAAEPSMELPSSPQVIDQSW